MPQNPGIWIWSVVSHANIYILHSIKNEVLSSSFAQSLWGALICEHQRVNFYGRWVYPTWTGVRHLKSQGQKPNRTARRFSNVVHDTQWHCQSPSAVFAPVTMVAAQSKRQQRWGTHGQPKHVTSCAMRISGFGHCEAQAEAHMRVLHNPLDMYSQLCHEAHQ